ncbi:MAG: DEAD/DEAH box helicase [Planctomycetes bacterium]|nr:DEAD/DEAH box helicase [Planctomycetota bacterium]
MALRDVAARATPGERFEWLETERPRRAREAPAEGRPGARAEPARRCPRCGWLDALTERECFRCGLELPHPDALPALDEPAYQLPARAIEALEVTVAGAARDALLHGVNADPRDWLLRRRSADLGILPGFDTLLVLGQVNPETFQRYAHQQAVARKALRELGGTALLADETGLGKTIEAGLIAKELLLRGLVRSVLVVVPASLALQWREEMSQKFGLEFLVARAPADLVGEPPLVIASYSAVRGEGVGRLLRERPVDLLICDEAHHLKNRGTKQYRAVARIRKKYTLLLSATPFHNRLVELKNLLDVLKPGLLGSTRAFNKQYVDEKDPRRPRNLHHLRALLGEVMIRNRRTEVAVKLPPRRAATYHVELHPDEQAFYDDLTELIQGEVRARAAEIEREHGRPMAVVLSLINLQRELCSSPRAVGKALRRLAGGELLPPSINDKLLALAGRADALEHWRKAQAVDEVLERYEGKLVVFCEFRATIASLAERLEARGITVQPFHGGMTAEEKHRAIERFRGEARVLIASRAGAEGLNVQFCSTVLNFDLPWNPMVVEQRIGRVHRLGQQNTVVVFNLSVKGTIEARILELLTHKLRLFTAVLGEVDLILGALHGERGFEDLLREAWLAGAVQGDLDAALDRFGRELERARGEYDHIKEAEAVVDELTPAPAVEEAAAAPPPSADGNGGGP